MTREQTDVTPPSLQPLQPSKTGEATGVAPQSAPRLEGVVPCAGCGYNLCGLQLGGRCPECGLQIQRSLLGIRLSVADPGWLRKVCRGCAILCGTGGVLLVGLLIAIAGGAIGRLNSGPGISPGSPLLLGVATITCTMVVPVCLAIGILRLTTLDARPQRVRQPLGTRAVLRVTGGMLFLLGSARFMLLAAGGSWPAVILGLDSAIIVMGLILLVGIGYYLAWLVLRLPDHKLAAKSTATARQLALYTSLGLLLTLVAVDPWRVVNSSGLLTLVRMVCGMVFLMIAGLILVFGAHLLRIRRVLSGTLIESQRLTESEQTSDARSAMAPDKEDR